ncbi:MAG: tRNA pseudouridine(55) synthase TruB [Lachnospiraceae bacterium]|nr:tRNA pseudouridine(55) synthase TruB [Lachnospiraceae bacterium]
MKSGFIAIDKPEGYTSFDVVAILRKVFNTKKIGHTGTLDPMATGVLLVCINKATKAVSVLPEAFKQYETTLRLGIATDTEDITGIVTKELPFSCDDEAIRDAVKKFVGDIIQIPPMYSAKKINGKKLYDLAREGITVERKPVNLHIENIEVVSIDLPDVSLRITCQKGTYIRTLCKDIGEELRSCACMTKLRRTETDSFKESDLIILSDLTKMNTDQAYSHLRPLDELFCIYQAIFTTPKGDFFMKNGNRLNDTDIDFIKTDINVRNCSENELFRVYDSSNNFKALYIKSGMEYKAFKMLID